MKVQARTWLAALVFLWLSGWGSARPTQAEEGAYEERIAHGKAEHGLDKLTVETSTARRSAEDLVSLRALYQPEGADRELEVLLNALGKWNAASPEKRSAKQAKELGRKLLAFYHPGRKSLVILDSKKNRAGKLNRMDFVIAFEIARAWRDSHSDLQASFAERAKTLEQSWILRCVLEGEVRLKAIEGDMAAMGRGLEDLTREQLDAPMLQAYPEEQLSWAQIYGARLALARWRVDGWQGVHAMWDAPPPSTEQILHPTKLGQDEPTAVTLPDWPSAAGEAELLSEDVLGELGMRSLFDELRVDQHKAHIAAAGWDGDLLRVYRTQHDELALIWRSVWDRELDAQQFAELIGEHGDGEVRVRGHVVDWSRTVEGPLSSLLLDHLASAPQDFMESPAAGLSSAAVEAEWERELQAGGFSVDERWVVPSADLSLAIPKRWRLRSYGGVRRLVPNRRKLAGASITLAASPIETGGDLKAALPQQQVRLEDLGFVVELAELRQVGDRAVGWLRYSGTLGHEFRAISALVAHGEQLFSITASAPLSAWTDVELIFEQALSGLRFGVQGLQRPEPEVIADSQARDEQDEFELQVVDLQGRPITERVDVWVGEYQSLSSGSMREDPGDLEREAHRIGQRFRTDERGRVRIRGGWVKWPWACVRDGDLFGFERIFMGVDRECELALSPDRELLVQVVDEQGRAVAGVPVGLLVKTSDSDPGYLVKSRVTAGELGEVRFPHVFSEIDGWRSPSAELYLTFAFPLKNSPELPIAFDAALDEPMQLVLPPTGSLLVDVDISGLELDEEIGEFRHGPGLIVLSDSELEGALTYYQPILAYGEGPELGEWQVYFPHVGLGLELNLSVGFDREPQRFRGPQLPGESLQVTAVPGQEVSPSWASSDDPALIGTCLDAAGEPLEDQEFILTLSNGKDASRPTSWTTGSFTTDGEGRFRNSLFSAQDREQVTQLLIETLPESELHLEYSTQLDSLPAKGSLDLGEITFEPSKILIAGRVVDGHGQPIEGAICVVNARAGGQWFRTSESGAFALRDKGQSEPFSFVVRADGFHKNRTEYATPGQLDVEIVLEAIEGATTIRGSILLDGFDDESDFHGWPRSLHVRIEPMGRPTPEAEEPSISYSSFEGRLSYEVKSLVPGRYRVHLDPVTSSSSGLAARRALARGSVDEPSVPPIEVTLGPGEELELEPFDLRGDYACITLSVVDRDGRPLPATIQQLGSRPTRGEVFSSTSFSNQASPLSLLSGPSGLNLQISSPGYRAVSFEALAEDTVVALLPVLRVELRPRGEVLLPGPEYQLLARLSCENEKTRFQALENGSAEFELSTPGTWTVTWAVGRMKGKRLMKQRAIQASDLVQIDVEDLGILQVIEASRPSPETIERLVRKLDD